MLLEDCRKDEAGRVAFPFSILVVEGHGLFDGRTVFGRDQAKPIVHFFV